jgi:ABC-type oligopeptide transport system substrate-binding subunit
VPGKVRGIAGLESPLVGREAEFAALQEAVQRLRDGVGGLVTLVGEAGIGKSRLVAEVRNLPHVIASPYSGEAIPEKEGGDCFPVGPPLSLDKDERPSPGANGGEKMPRHRQTDGEIFDNDKPVAWVEGRCLSYGHSVAYLLWLDVLRALLGVSLEDAPPAVLERLQERVQAACPDRFDDVYPYVARLVSLPLEDDLAAKLDDMDGQDLKAHTFQAVQTLIECAANQQPLVLVCEDLHWADPTSIELLEQVLPLTERAPLLLLCVFRPVKDHRCWRFRELAAQAHAERHTDLLLEALSAAESETLVANLLRIEDLPEVLRERILSRAEGNPFYVEEVVRSLIDRGAIVQDPDTGRWTATREVADIPIPDTLQGVLMARIDRLQEEVKRVLQMASVIGRIFLYRVLEAIAEEKRRLDEHLLTLKYQEMIRERARIPELEYIFKHDLTREAAYNGLLKKARRVFHRQVAEALERLFPERIEEQLGLLAYHWEQARDAEKAAHYLERAGDQARLLYSHDEAIDYYERALVFLKAQDEHEHAARTLMKLGLTHHSAFDFNSSRLAHEQAFALFQRAAAQEPATPPAPAPHALRIGGLGQPDSLDPGTCVYGDVSAALFSGLLEWAPDWTIVPGVAASWEVLEGGRKYVFHLRHDVRWSDGRKVTAHDFAYAWKRVLDSGTGAPYASLLYDVKGAKPFHQGQVPDGGQVGIWATDDATLVVELEGPCGYFLHLMAYFVTRPVPRHVVQAHGPGWADPSRIVTNGPFCLERWKQEESLHLVRNPAYHDRFRGNVERIEMSLASEWDNQLHLYEGDELDILDTTFFRPGEELNAARRRHAGQSVTGPSMAVMCYAFDVSRPPLHDPRVRRALVMAVDREATLDTLSPGAFAPPAGGLVPPGVPGHSPGIAVPYDPEQARRLLAEAGYPGGRGFRALHGIAGGSTIVLCELWQTAWRGILGIEIEWEVPTERFDGPGYRAGADMFPAHWGAAYPDPDSFLRAGIYRERTHWRHEAYDRLVEQARRLTDQSERMRLYRQADQILTEEAPIVPVAYGAWHWLVKPWVRNAVRGWKDIIIEPH